MNAAFAAGAHGASSGDSLGLIGMLLFGVSGIFFVLAIVRKFNPPKPKDERATMVSHHHTRRRRHH